MATVSIYKAKTNLSKLVDAAMEGEFIIITKAGKPVAMLTPITNKTQVRTFGLLKGKVSVTRDFNASLSNDLLSDFES